MQRLLEVVAVAVILVSFAVSCGGPSPEQRVRNLIEAAEQAAENRDRVALGEMVSANYGDDRGRDRATIEALLQQYFFVNRSIHVLMRIRNIAVLDGGRATATIDVAIAAIPIPDPTRLDQADADLHRIEIDLVDVDGEWKVSSADWRPLALTDFL